MSHVQCVFCSSPIQPAVQCYSHIAHKWQANTPKPVNTWESLRGLAVPLPWRASETCECFSHSMVLFKLSMTRTIQTSMCQQTYDFWLITVIISPSFPHAWIECCGPDDGENVVMTEGAKVLGPDVWHLCLIQLEYISKLFLKKQYYFVIIVHMLLRIFLSSKDELFIFSPRFLVWEFSRVH